MQTPRPVPVPPGEPRAAHQLQKSGCAAHIIGDATYVSFVYQLPRGFCSVTECNGLPPCQASRDAFAASLLPQSPPRLQHPSDQKAGPDSELGWPQVAGPRFQTTLTAQTTQTQSFWDFWFVPCHRQRIASKAIGRPVKTKFAGCNLSQKCSKLPRCCLRVGNWTL